MAFAVVLLDGCFGSSAHGGELVGRGGGDLAEEHDCSGRVAVARLPADLVPVEEIRGVARAGTDEQDRAADRHRTVNLARMNHPHHVRAERHHVHIRAR